MNHPNPPPPLSSAIAKSSTYSPNKALTRHPRPVDGGPHAATERGQSTAARTETDVDARRDVVDVLDRLTHLWQRLSHLFVRRVEELLDGSQRAAQPDQHRRQGQRHDERGHSEGDPHEALAAQRVNTPGAPAANTTAIVSASALLA